MMRLTALSAAICGVLLSAITVFADGGGLLLRGKGAFTVSGQTPHILVVNLTNSVFVAGSPVGTSVGDVQVAMQVPSFTGSLALDTTCGANCADSSKFQLVGSGCANATLGSCTLQTAAGGAVNPTFAKSATPAASFTVAVPTGGGPTGSTALGAVTWDFGGGGSVTGITDNAVPSNTYVLGPRVNDAGHAQAFQCFYKQNITGTPTSIVAATTGTVGFPATAVDFYNGAAVGFDGGTPLGATVQSPASGGAINGPAITTTVANDVIWSAYTSATQGVGMAARGGATARSSLTNILLSEENTGVAIGSFTPSATASAAGGTFIPCAIAMKPSAAGLVAGSYKIQIVATQAGADNSPFPQALTVTGAAGPTFVNLNPSSATVADNCTVAACPTPLSAVTVTMSDGSTFAGSLAETGFTGCTMSGSNVIVARTLTAADDGAKVCTITATQNGISASANLAVTVQLQTIASTALSNLIVASGSPTNTTVGTLTSIMSPAQPAFSGSYALGTTGCAGTNNASFNILAPNTLRTTGAIADGTYAICIVSAESGLASIGTAFTISVGVPPDVPGPSAWLYNHPYYTCSTNRFTSPNGSGLQNGLTSADSWSFATALTQALSAGTCMNMATGIYARTSGLDFTHGGNAATPTGYVVWRCSTMPFSFSGGALQGEGSGCVIRATSALFTLTGVGVPYIMFDGIEIDGQNFLASGHCSNIQAGAPTAHHIWMFNSDVHGCGYSGIQWNNTDWIFLIHNVWHDNSNAADGSGLSIWEPIGLTGYTPTAADNAWCSSTTSLCYHIITAYNAAYHNHNSTVSGDTDGNGIIYDDWGWTQSTCPGTGTCPYTAPGLMMGNLMWFNGGGGLKAVQHPNTAQQITVVNNTAYNNYWDPGNSATWRGSIDWEFSFQTRFINNISYTVRGAAPTNNNSAFSIQGTSSPSNVTLENNFAYPAGTNNLGTGVTYSTSGATGNRDGVDPLFVSVSPSSSVGNFALQAGSPARNFGQVFDLWQQTTPGAIDAGACVRTLTSCP
jgi:hypothetical protein